MAPTDYPFPKLKHFPVNNHSLGTNKYARIILGKFLFKRGKKDKNLFSGGFLKNEKRMKLYKFFLNLLRTRKLKF